MDKKAKTDFLKALLVPDSVADERTNYLPKPIADDVVKKIEEMNIARQLFKVVKVAGANLTIPLVSADLGNVYQVGTASANDMSNNLSSELEPSVSAIVLEPGKIAAKARIDMDDIDDSSLDIMNMVLENFGEAFAAKEEQTIMTGAKDRTSAVATKVADGLFTIAQNYSSTSTVSVDSSQTYSVSNGISEAIKELGKYARGYGELLLIVDDAFAHALRTDRDLRADVYGSGVVLKDGKLPKVYGVNVWTTSYAPSSKGVLVPAGEPMIGDGKTLKIARDEDIEKDQVVLVATRRFDFKLRHKTGSNYDAIVLLEDTNS